MALEKLTLSKDSIQWLFKFIRGQRARWIIYTCLKSISGIIGVGVALVTRSLIDSAIEAQMSDLLFYGVLLGFALVFEIFMKSIRTYLKTKLRYHLVNSSQLNIIKQCLSMKWFSYSQYRTGDLITRINGDIKEISNIWMSIIPGFIALIIQFATAFTTLALFDFTLAIFLFMVSPLALLISWYIGKYLKPIQAKLRGAQSNFSSYLTDLLSHFTIVKVFQAEHTSAENIADLQEEKYNIAFKLVKFKIFSNIIITIAYSVSLFAVFMWGSYKIAVGALTFGTFTAYLQLISQIQGPVEGMAGNISSFISATASIDRVIALEQEAMETSVLDNKPIPNPPKISSSDIDFRYTNDTPYIFKNMSFEIEPGEKVAFVGPSGQGKTTLIRLILSLLDAKKGALSLESNNKPLHLSEHTRNYFTYVPQGDTLFSGTIRDNLLLAKKLASESELNHVLKIACADQFVSETEDGIDTRLGEHGVGLSQGQAQRIAIARACLRNAGVLILDEATSGLDLETEKQIYENLFSAYKDKTIIVISHRETILKYAHKVYKLENNKLSLY